MRKLLKFLVDFFSQKSKQQNQFVLYQRCKFEIPFYINEVALYQFILERQTYTPAERADFMNKHAQACRQCLKAIRRLDNVAADLGLSYKGESIEYLQRYQQHSTIVYTKLTYPYFELNHN